MKLQNNVLVIRKLGGPYPFGRHVVIVLSSLGIQANTMTDLGKIISSKCISVDIIVYHMLTT